MGAKPPSPYLAPSPSDTTTYKSKFKTFNYCLFMYFGTTKA